MKRWVASLILSSLAGVVMAQAPFTIVRPQDGSKVREKVRILIPKGSVPETGYVGIFLDGKFIEARGIDSLIPADKATAEKYMEYVLDTKGRGIPDSEPGKPIKLEIVRYVDDGLRTMITKRSSVDLYVANSASIPVPKDGFSIKYGFKPGSELVYNVEIKTSVASITQGGNRSGGRTNDQDVSIEKIRVLYAIDNRYENGDGLLRMQALPNKGKDYTFTTVEGGDTPRKFTENEMEPAYQRLSSSGREIWGSIPTYFGIEGNNGAVSSTNLIVAIPLPSLPISNKRPGDTWRGEFQLPGIDSEKLREVNTLVRKQTARGEFVGVEWEQGHPCAVLRNSISVGDSTLESEKLKKAGAKMSGDKTEVEENTWFALDTKVVLKRTLSIAMDVSADKIGLLGGGSSTGAGAQGSGPVGGGMSGGPGKGPGAPGAAGSPDGFFELKVQGRAGGGRRGGGAQSGPPGAGFGPGGPPPSMGGPGGPPPGGGFGPPGQGGFGSGRQGGDPNAGQLAFVRVKYLITMQLEK